MIKILTKKKKIVISFFMALLVFSISLVFLTQTVTAVDKKVALITSMGGLGDKSFNDMAAKGLEKAEKEFGIESKIIEPGAVTEGERYLSSLAKMGYDLILTLEYGHADMVERVAPQFPETTFGVFNLVVNQPNVVSVVFKEHQASFLAGALAAMVTKDSNIEETNNEKTIGVIGGVDSPGINKFLVGYEEGANYIDEDVKVLSSYANSFEDPSTGRELSLVQINRGADVIFQVAGATGQGIIEAVDQKDKFAIGVDADQDYMAKGNVLTSVMKRMDVAVYELCQNLDDELLEGGKTITLGLEDNGVSLTEMRYTKEKIPNKYINKINELKEKIINGKIKVTNVAK